jgi:hypothetical protein
MSAGLGSDGSSCLSPESVRIRSTIAGSVSIIELSHGNMLAISLSAGHCVAVRNRQRCEREITLSQKSNWAWVSTAVATERKELRAVT